MTIASRSGQWTKRWYAVAEQRSSFDAFQSEFDYLCRALRRLGVRAEDIEDEAHEVFLVLDRKWAEYDRARPLRPYLFGIAFRVVSARRRRQGREVSRPLDDVPGTEPGQDRILEIADTRRLVLAALSRVPLERRAVLVMHDIDEVAMRDIAKTLSIPMFTGYSRLRKARQEFEAAVRALQKEIKAP